MINYSIVLRFKIMYYRRIDLTNFCYIVIARFR